MSSGYVEPDQGYVGFYGFEQKNDIILKKAAEGILVGVLESKKHNNKKSHFLSTGATMRPFLQCDQQSD